MRTTKTLSANRLIATALALSAAATSGSVMAGETSATNFPLGVNTALSGIYPPAGATEYYNYNLFYSAGKYKSDAANPAPPSLHTNVFVEAFRVNHTWVNLTSSVTLGSGFAINFVHQDLRVGNAKGSVGFAFADPDIIPYNINWQVNDKLWIAHIFNIFPKWGDYSKTKIVNAGLNYTTFSPELAATYMPTPLWEISLDARYGFNEKNKATDYKSGNDFTIDYVAGYRPLASLPDFQLALSGYYYKQVGNDFLNGVKVGNGNQGQAFAIGPSFRYDIGHGGLIFKWQHELAVQNRTQGDRVWFQFAIPL